MQERQQAIMVVEDDLNLSEMLRAYFTIQGYRVTLVPLGETVVGLAAEAQPDLIILDIHLPDVDGFEVCKRLRASHLTRAIPILFLTEVRDRPDILHGLELGVVDYITKPFDMQELLLRVRNNLHRAASTGIENPVTQLPEGDEVEATLTRLAAEELPDHSVLAVSVEGIGTFRELYGFVASDDVLRVVALTISQSTLEVAGPEAFCGHLDGHTFVIVLGSEHLQPLLARIHKRLDATLEYFYPGDNRGANAWSGDRLRLAVSALPASAAIESAEALKDQLRAALEEAAQAAF